MGGFSITHWIILLIVVVVVFGTSKLKNAGKDLGSAVKGFKDAVKDTEEQDKLTAEKSDAIDSQASEIKTKENAKSHDNA